MNNSDCCIVDEEKDDCKFALDLLSMVIYKNAKNHGWWDEDIDCSDGTKLCLIHSEVSEVLEAYRDGNPKSEKIPNFSKAEEELADVIIRILDFSASKGYRIGEALIAKHHFNIRRPYRHGGKKM